MTVKSVSAYKKSKDSKLEYYRDDDESSEASFEKEKVPMQDEQDQRGLLMRLFDACTRCVRLR